MPHDNNIKSVEMVAHQLANILTTIRALADAVGERVDDDVRARRHLQQIDAAAERAGALVAQLANRTPSGPVAANDP